jgi:hypothetical protein
MFVQSQLSAGEKSFPWRGRQFLGALKTVFQNQSWFDAEQQERLTQGDQLLAALICGRALLKEYLYFDQPTIGLGQIVFVKRRFSRQQTQGDVAGKII